MSTPAKKTRAPRTKKSPPVVRLDLGCGTHKQPGFLGVDYIDGPDVDFCHDLTVFPWPFSDNSVDEIITSHLVEHIPMVEVDYPGFDRPIDALCAFMNEVWRILKPGAGITIAHPHHASDRAFWDPTHRRFIPPMTWHYFTASWREVNNLTQYPITGNFDLLSMTYQGVEDKWAQRTEEVRDDAIRERRNIVADTNVLLRKPEDA